MKFTKEEVSKVLATKMTSKGESLSMSERSINEFLETLIPVLANEETEMTDFVDKVYPMFETTNANVRNDNSVFAKNHKAESDTKLAELQKELDVYKNGKVAEKKAESGTESDSKIDAIMKELQEMKAAQVASQEKELVSGKRASLIESLKANGMKDQAHIDAYLSMATITKDTDINVLSGTIVDAYNKVVASKSNNTNPTDGGRDGKPIDYNEQFQILGAKINN